MIRSMASFSSPLVALLLLALAGLRGEGQQLDPIGPQDDMNAGITMSIDGKDAPQFVVIDGKWRWVYNAGSTCSAESSDAAAMEHCYLQGLSASDYKSKYGVYVGQPSSRAITLKYASKNGDNVNYGSRVFLTDGTGYTLFKPLGGEISFKADVRNVPAGMNAAVYLVSMDRLGNLDAISPNGVPNTAGWKRGMGYCDAQCPKDLQFAQDAGFNAGHLASCCPEMDLFEANRFTTSMTPHPCKLPSRSICDANQDANCKARCDSDGADVNPFRERGPGSALFEMLDIREPFEVRTLFRTDNNRSDGSLVAIEQVFSQELKDGTKKNFTISLTDESVAKSKELFRASNGFGTVYGGLKSMGEALRRGMVMVLALWNEPGQGGNMNWLNSCGANKSMNEYDCSEHAKFDKDVWSEAWNVQPGIWRGPADYYPDFDTSYKVKQVTFNYEGIPAELKTQAKFTCDGCETKGDSCDCAGNSYQFTVSDFAVTSKQGDIGTPLTPLQPPGSQGSNNILLHWLFVAGGVAVVIAAAICCCYHCKEDDTQNVGISKKRFVDCEADDSESGSS
eukprot:TRINITY_DN89411_c0_g1_i1.p1 TRINITY_DN89411_c0_g1~~TRINITY_DN89411_c0_g1_i1.p1  ORF type:complete len:564 (-),score=96.86 TRINITY_DN89411_c0_g1_i1:257-1948(-)